MMPAKRTRLHWSYLPRSKYPGLKPLMFLPEGMVKTIKFTPENSIYREDYYDVLFDSDYIFAYVNYKVLRPLEIKDQKTLIFLAENIKNIPLEGVR
jgi:hypothetical protein